MTLPDQQHPCPRCGAPADPGTKFCGSCGQPMGDRVPTLPSASPGREGKYGVAAKAGSADEATPSRGIPTWAWLVSGVVVVCVAVLVVVLIVTAGRSDAGVAAADEAPPAATTDAAPPVSSLEFTTDCTDETTCPAVRSLVGQDVGGRVRITMRYCDRNGSDTQRFAYTFRLLDADQTPQPWTGTITRNQKYACNTVTSTLGGTYAQGEYQVEATIRNLANEGRSRTTSAGFPVG